MERAASKRRLSRVRRLMATAALAFGMIGVTAAPSSAALLQFNTCVYYYGDYSYCAYASYDTPAWVWSII